MKRSLTDLELKGKSVFLRADLNVPLDEYGNITDDTKIYEELPTIKYILKNGGRIILASHLGRPNGEFNQKYSMFPVAQQLIRYLFNKIYFAVDVVGPDATEKAKKLKDGEILVIENLRFHKEEELNDLYFARKLANMADVYVNDAFGTIHRKHASIYRLPKLLTNNAMGFLMEKEIKTIENATENPERPFTAILGGVKVSDKIGVVKNLLKKADNVLIGGAMAFTFLKSKGINIGKSIIDEENIEIAKNILDEAVKLNKNVILPIDIAASEIYSPKAKAKYYNINKIPSEVMGLDIGPKTIKLYKKYIQDSKTIIWNGPMGVFEFSNFSNGTSEIAKAVSKNKGLTIVGGGDSIAAIKSLQLEDTISHLSTGGGATLALLEGGDLPGLEALSDI